LTLVPNVENVGLFSRCPYRDKATRYKSPNGCREHGWESAEAVPDSRFEIPEIGQHDFETRRSQVEQEIDWRGLVSLGTIGAVKVMFNFLEAGGEAATNPPVY